MDVSTESSVGSPSSGTDTIYRCSHCPKQYNRSDYLRRHELNHAMPQSVCPACNKRFARPDVLRKHLRGSCQSRRGYAEGPTDMELDAVVPRQRKRQRRRSTGPVSRSPEVPSSSCLEEASLRQDYHRDMAAETSPLNLSGSNGIEDRDNTDHHRLGHSMAPPVMATEGLVAVDLPPESFPEATSGFGLLHSAAIWRSSVGSSEQLLHSATTSLIGAQRPSVDMGMSLSAMSQSSDIPISIEDNLNDSLTVPGASGTPQANDTANSMDVLFNWLFSMTNLDSIASRSHVGLAGSGRGDSYPGPPAADPIDTGLAGSRTQHLPGSPMAETNPRVPQTNSYPPSPAPHSDGPPFPPLPENWVESGWRFPPPRDVIDEQARAGMRDLFEGSDKDYFASPAFSLVQMKLYLELYFLHFSPLYPVIHRSSLGYRRLPPDLLLTMLCIGTAFATDREGFQVALKLHKRLRNRVFEMVETEPRASPHTLATILLINYFSRSYCSVKEHAVAQIFHSSSIAMARLAGAFLPKFTEHPNPVATNPLDHWLEWVKYEERKRVGWLAFLMDTENAALYRHYLIVHFFSVQIDWPCQQDVWEAGDPFAWSALQRSTVQPISFRAALHEIAARGTVPNNMSETHLWILVHGLISVSWTLLWRDLGDLNMVRETQIVCWKSLLCHAFEALREHLTATFRRRLGDADRDEALDMHMFWSGLPLAHLGCILLLSDTESIRIQAGAESIAGRPVLPGEWGNANAYVLQWARSQDGARSCATAIELLSELFKWSHEVRFQTAPSLVPWCLYIASLVVWAYATSLDGPASFDEPYILRASGPPVLDDADTAPPPPTAGVIKIEPSLARRDALAYLIRFAVDATDLPQAKGKNRCGGILAYSAYLCGTVGRGVMDEARGVLLRILSRGSR